MYTKSPNLKPIIQTVVILLCIIITNKTYSQTLEFTKLTSKNGLSNSHIYDIEQDNKGFIWIATNYGLNRFDGLNVETFLPYPNDSTTISNSIIYDIFIDNNHNLWFGTFVGVCRYNNKTGIFENLQLPTTDNISSPTPVKAITQTKNGHIWLGTSGGGMIEIDTKNNVQNIYRHNDNANSLISDHIIALETDFDDNIWIGTENKGVSIFNTKTKTFSTLQKENNMLNSNSILTIHCDKNNGNIWIGTFYGGISMWSKREQTIKHFYNSFENGCLSGNMVYSITNDHNNNIWIGTQDAGLFMFDSISNTFINYSTKKQNVKNLISDNIHKVYFDYSNNLWLGIFQGGINIQKRKSNFDIATYNPANPQNSLSPNSVLGILPISKKQVYIATDGGGLNIWNTEKNTVEHITAGNNKLETNIIRVVYQGFDGRIWLGTYLRGLMEYNPTKKTFTAYQNIPGDSTSLSNNDVTTIIEDRLGNLWIGTNGGGICLFNKKTGKFKRFQKEENNKEKSLVSNFITTLYLDKRGYLWAGTFWGLSRLDPLRYEFKNIIHQQTDNSNSYFCILEDSNQRLWAGTMNGLKLINQNDNSFKLFTTRNGLPNNVINGIEEDNSGNIWISTNNGISCFNPENETFRNFYEEDGLQSNEFIHGSFAKNEDGEIFFGGINGINKFLPQKIVQNATSPKVIFTKLLIFNQEITCNQTIDKRKIIESQMSENPDINLTYKDNSFSIIFSAIEFNEPTKIKYAYRMKGFDKDWNIHDYNKNIATYTNLDAGTYYFELKACNSGEKWSNPSTLKITIKPPFWQTWWARTTYIVILFGILLILWKFFRQKEEEKHQLKIESLMQQKDNALNKTRLQFFTNISHEFRTPLTLIMGPLENMMESKKYDDDDRHQFAIIHRNAERLLRLVNQIMDLRKIDNNKIQFNPEKTDIVSFIKEIYENFDNLALKRKINFTFESDFETCEIVFDKEKIDKAIYNLLSNSFKFTEKGGKINISIKKSDQNNQSIVIIVEDNGKGIPKENQDKIFDRFFQSGTSEIQQGTGIGLWLTKYFVEMHNGIINVSSKPQQGTAFTIILPANYDLQTNQNKENYIHIAPTKEYTTDYDNKTIGEFPIDDIKVDQPHSQTILIIEDNIEIRQYLKSGLSKIYNIETANNGKVGLQIAKNILPDLVITDVMMPELDGNQLCKILKSDIETCHIPIIMLTAKASEKQRIEGLETGADSYITKPFNPKHLAVRISKLIELRKILREKFSDEINFQVEQTAITVPDRNLLDKVSSVIKKRISDPNLNVENLSEDIGISRGHLQRKLKNLTGQNPNEFIRIIRLKQAAEILAQNNDVTIAEVADMVGFNSQSYFSTSFTKQFNISPKQYKEQLNKQA